MRVAMTGGATGIGAAVAAQLKAEGHAVTAFDIRRPDAPVDRWVPVDMGDPAAIRAALDVADGPYDALINNAGLPPREGLEEVILRVNFLGLREFLDGMLDRLTPGAAIVNTASRAGAMWRENLDEVRALMALEPDGLKPFIAARKIDHVRAYNLSKEAVIAMTVARAEEMIGRGFRMNAVSPAAVSTGILDDFVTAFGDRAQAMAARVGRAARPGEIADVICFLASPRSRWIKGQDIAVDGGASALARSDMLFPRGVP